MSLEETILWATNRAKEAFKQSPCDFWIGIESWLMPSSQAGTWYFACEACVFWDGKKEYIWIGGGFQYPKPALERVITYWEDLSTAFKNAWFTEDNWIGSKDWIIWYLTQWKLPRKEYTKQITIYALSQIHHKHLF
jgi:non-canonical (house-cleaning) NTP pyrophosphatase